jgi:hypothetical protein
MSLASEVDNPAAIDNLVESSLESKNEDLRLEWISYEEINNIEPTPTNDIYYASRKHKVKETMLLLLGSSEECTPALVSEFARIYSLPTHKYNNVDNKRYSEWLEERNEHINGFTKYEDKFYMVADKLFYHCYSRYGFCTACGTLRSSPVWCICGHKQVSDGWTSNNKQLDEFIKKSQLQTNSANDAYLEWIPFDGINDWRDGDKYLNGLPTSVFVKLIPLEITDSTHDLYYAEVNYLLMRHVY